MNKLLTIILVAISIVLLPNVSATYTNVSLNTSEVMMDSDVQIGAPDGNTGTATEMKIVGTDDKAWLYLVMNLTHLPTDQTIVDGEICLTINTGRYQGALDIDMYEINNSVSAANYGETTITWNNQPAGTDSNNYLHKNSSIADSVTTSGVATYCWNWTATLRKAYNGNKGNVSLFWETETGGGLLNGFATKEHDATTITPFGWVMMYGATAGPTFTITTKDFHNGSTVNSFTAIVSNATETYTNVTTTGQINFENITQGIYDITIQSTEAGGYFERTYENINASNDLEAKIWQAVVYINASDIVDGTKISAFGATTGTQLNHSNSTGWATLRLNAKSHDIVGNTSTYFSTTQNLSLSALEEKYFTLEFGRNKLSINASDIFSNQSVSSFTINVIGLNVTYDRTLSTTTGQINFSLSNGNYSMAISGSTIAKAYANITVDTTITNHTFQVFSINSIYIQTFIEGTSTLLKPNQVKASFDSDLSVFNLSTTNATIYSENMILGAYTITMSSSGYTSRDYFITLNSGENVQLNAYLANTTNYEEITFTIEDVVTLETLEGVVVSVSEKINLSYMTIAQASSDIAGQVLFTLDQTKEYRFTLNAEGYLTKVFNLKPISTAYTVTLDRSIVFDWSTIFSKITYLLLPNSTSTSAGEYVNFSIITSSLSGAVQNYFGLNTTYLGIEYKTNVSGSPAGGTADIVLNLSNASFSTISIGYFISVSGEDIIYINRDFYLSNITYYNESVAGVKEILKQNVNSGYLAIIAVLGTILIMGTFHGIGIKGNKLSVVGAMSMGVFTYFGFIHPDPIKNALIGSIITITLLGSYFILTRLGD